MSVISERAGLEWDMVECDRSRQQRQATGRQPRQGQKPDYVYLCGYGPRNVDAQRRGESHGGPVKLLCVWASSWGGRKPVMRVDRCVWCEDLT
eukprot:25304-Eustigmatos_ZCMA.PRE.1